MVSFDTVEIIVIIGITAALLAILFGPTLFSRYQNWKMKEGLKK